MKATGEPAAATAAAPHRPWALTSHDLFWGVIVAVLSIGMFVLTPLLAALRKLDIVSIGWGWIFLPAILCVIAVFLHGIFELGRSLLYD